MFPFRENGKRIVGGNRYERMKTKQHTEQCILYNSVFLPVTFSPRIIDYTHHFIHKLYSEI